jgi:hypothetical protein
VQGHCGSGGSTGAGVRLSRDVTVTGGEWMIVIRGEKGTGAGTGSLGGMTRV